MKLTGIVSIGTYWSPWFAPGLASIYFCDEIIVVNGGYNLKNPKISEFNIPLEQVSRDISDLDVDGKVYEWKGWTLSDLKHKLVLATEKDHPPTRFWADMRGIGLTLALEKAINRGASWILKFDSDQVCYRNCIRYKEDLEKGRVGSVIFKQYEFSRDIYHLYNPPPDSPWNDSIYSFKADPTDFFGGGGAPAITDNRVPSEDYHCAHLRYANPLDLFDSEAYAHYYGRKWFSIHSLEGKWNKALHDRAASSASHLMSTTGERKPSDVPPPEVCLMKPKEYIEEVIKG